MEIAGDLAAKIFGRDCLDQAVADRTYGPLVVTAQMPTDPVELELEKARLRGEFAIQRVDTFPGGKAKTMYNMVLALQERFDQKDWGQILYAKIGNRWYQDERFFMEATPRPGWALVSKEPIPGSTNRNYYQQTGDLGQWINGIYQDREMPTPYQDALKQWAEEKSRGSLERFLYSDPIGTTRVLAAFDLNQLLRERPVEVLDGMLELFNNTEERRLRDIYTWTNAIAADGVLVGLGRFDPGGVDVGGWHRGHAASGIGVCSNRSYL